VVANESPTRREPLTRDRIIDASLKIIESEGLDALSMRRLGKELHVKDMALYYHFEKKDEILTSLVGRMFDAFGEVRSDGKSWKEYMSEVMHAFRRVGINYPQTFLLYARRPWGDANRAGAGDIDALVEAGFDRVHAEYVLRNLADYVTGFVVRHDVARLTEEPAEDDFDADAAFEFGLTAILDGCEHWLKARG
jgi:AcrR family transcriptional regulator